MNEHNTSQNAEAAHTQKHWGRYTELRPEELDAIRAAVPVVYMPWGALDWHGPHMPLGADGIVAEAIAEQLVQRTGGVLLPTTWWPAASVPQPTKLAVRRTVISELWSDLFDGIAAAGWKVLVLINGHYCREHELVLMDVAEQMIQQERLLVLALPPLSIIDESLLDHGAIWETSLLLALRPELVDMYALDQEDTQPDEHGIQGRDPRGTASPSLGDTVLHLAVERIIKAVEALVSSGDPAPLYALYEQRRERYQQTT